MASKATKGPSVSTATDTTTDSKVKLKPVTMWRVVFHNDDYTPMDFVTAVLIRFYNKTLDEAEQIMLRIHKEGRGVAGVYIREIAEQKANDTVKIARLNGHPLLATAEEA